MFKRASQVRKTYGQLELQPPVLLLFAQVLVNSPIIDRSLHSRGSDFQETLLHRIAVSQRALLHKYWPLLHLALVADKEGLKLVNDHNFLFLFPKCLLSRLSWPHPPFSLVGGCSWQVVRSGHITIRVLGTAVSPRRCPEPLTLAHCVLLPASVMGGPPRQGRS